MNKNIIISIILLLLSVILITGFFSLTPDYVQITGTQKHYEDSAISFDYPNTWTLWDYENPLKTSILSDSPNQLELDPDNTTKYNTQLNNNSSSVVNSNGAQNASDVIIIKTEITRETLNGSLSLDNAYESNNLYKLMKDTASYKMVSNNSTTINKHQAKIFVYEVSSKTYQETWIQASNGQYYKILNECPTALYKTVQQEFNIIINSFNIK
ncbi:MAG: hypothetical protein Q4Q23_05030 [Methanobacteriaceae archaeon]|nr:hypothetical protein [Methanobacteriaceae archaeon]